MNPFVYSTKKLTSYYMRACDIQELYVYNYEEDDGSSVFTGKEIVWTAWRWSIKELGMRRVW